MPQKIAYLVNQYPATSHSFIRREIVALEEQGFEVLRFSVRPPPAALVDPADIADERKTRVLLRGGPVALFRALVRAAVSKPRSLVRALAAAARLGRRSERGLLRHLVYLAEACLLTSLLDAEGDVGHLHAHFGTNSAAVAMLARLVGGPSYSFTIHGPEEFDHPSELALDEKIRHAAVVIAVSDFGRSQIYRWCALSDWPKVHVIHCGVDEAFLAAGPQPVVDNRTLVCVGRLAEQKGQLLLVEALAALVAEGIEVDLVFAGDGPLRPIIEERVRQLGLESRIRITGWVSNATVRAELLAARALILTSFAEGLPVVLMEALALGRPAITTYIAGIPELVEDGRSGWLIPAGSVEAIGQAIKTALAASPDELTRMAAAGAKAVRERHDARREAGRLADLFRKLTTSTSTEALSRK